MLNVVNTPSVRTDNVPPAVLAGIQAVLAAGTVPDMMDVEAVRLQARRLGHHAADAWLAVRRHHGIYARGIAFGFAE